MGAELAITVVNTKQGGLQQFRDEIVAKMELVDEGKWILLGRVVVGNSDGDSQYVTAKLVHDANVVIDEVRPYVHEYEDVCLVLQAGFLANGRETITLEANTYKGWHSSASIVAFKVDDIDFQ